MNETWTEVSWMMLLLSICFTTESKLLVINQSTDIELNWINIELTQAE